MATNAENLAKLKTLYETILSNLLASEALGSDTITVDGVTLSNKDAYDKLERLAKIPGVAPIDPYEVWA